MSPTLRKAAILVSSLDTRSADALLDQMGETQAAQVRHAIMELGDIEAREQEQVIAEFLRGRQAENSETGVELDLSASAQSESLLEPIALGEPFAFLHQTDGETIATCLKQERPQIVAVVLAHLPPPHAAEVLAHLPSALQGEVLRRIARLDPTEPAVMRELEQHLRECLAPYLRTAQETGRGLSAIEAILKAAPSKARTGLLAQLDKTDPLLAREVARQRIVDRGERSQTPIGRETTSDLKHPSAVPPPLPDTRPPTPIPSSDDGLRFDDLARLDERSWSILLRTSNPQVALLALTGADPRLVDRAFARLSSREARDARRKLEHPGPVRLRDLDEAREELLDLARELAEEGRLTLPSGRRFAAAA